jgi:hypothetical protein
MAEYRVEFYSDGGIKHINTFAKDAKEARANVKRSANIARLIEIIRAFKAHKR